MIQLIIVLFHVGLKIVKRTFLNGMSMVIPHMEFE